MLFQKDAGRRIGDRCQGRIAREKQDGDLPGRGLSERERVLVAGSFRPEVDVGFVARRESPVLSEPLRRRRRSAFALVGICRARRWPVGKERSPFRHPTAASSHTTCIYYIYNDKINVNCVALVRFSRPVFCGSAIYLLSQPRSTVPTVTLYFAVRVLVRSM